MGTNKTYVHSLLIPPRNQLELVSIGHPYSSSRCTLARRGYNFADVPKSRGKPPPSAICIPLCTWSRSIGGGFPILSPLHLPPWNLQVARLAVREIGMFVRRPPLPDRVIDILTSSGHHGAGMWHASASSHRWRLTGVGSVCGLPGAQSRK